MSVIVCLLMVSFSACSSSTSPVAPSGTNDDARTADVIAEFWYGTQFTTDLVAGQNLVIGTVTVTNDSDYLYVHAEATLAGWVITETHVAAYTSLDEIPATKKGTPKVGQFDYDIESAIPLSEFSPCTEDLYLAVHVVAQLHDSEGNVTQEETGWGDGTEFTDDCGWAMYFTYGLQKGIPVPDPNCVTIQSAHPGGNSYWDTYILDGLGDLEELYRTGYEDGEPYRGWCVDLYHYMTPGTIYYCVEVYPSTSPDLFPEGDSRFDTDWNIIDWIFNNRTEYTNVEVQDAIWYHTDDKIISGPALELALAAAEHPDYVPPPCGWLSVILRAGNNQLIMIEIDP
jgi:hypothetical protein